MKFKHQKWIAREIGRDNWEETEVDNCDTYQKMFAEQGNLKIKKNLLANIFNCIFSNYF